MPNFVLLAWVAASAVLFRRRPDGRTLAALFVFGTLFLPEVRAGATHVPEMPEPLALPGFKLTKPNAVALGLLLGALASPAGRLALRARPRWFDAPAAVWCLSPLLSALANSLFYDDPVSKYDPAFLPSAGALGGAVAWLEYSGLYDGLTQSVDAALAWLGPYWLGRALLPGRDGARELAFWAVAGGLAYAPLCLLETRVSPQLHRWVYGFHQHDFSQSIRLGGFRPTVFLEHGIAVGFWMVAAATLAGWLWRCGDRRPAPLVPKLVIGGAPVALGLAATAVLCKSTGALALGAAGAAALLAARRLGALPLIALLAVPPLYVATRASGAWDGQGVVDFVAANVEEDRAASLAFRLRNEDVLAEKASERIVFGWGGFGRSRVYDEDGNDTTVTDGLWVIALGERGLVGLCALGLTLLLPPARLAFVQGVRLWREPAWGAAAAWAVLLALFAVDCLMNAMVNGVYLLAAGALAGTSVGAEPVAPAGRKRARVLEGRSHGRRVTA